MVDETPGRQETLCKSVRATSGRGLGEKLGFGSRIDAPWVENGVARRPRGRVVERETRPMGAFRRRRARSRRHFLEFLFLVRFRSACRLLLLSLRSRRMRFLVADQLQIGQFSSS